MEAKWIYLIFSSNLFTRLVFSNKWAYVEFPTSKEGQEFIDTYRGKKDDERPKMDGDNFIISVIKVTVLH